MAMDPELKELLGTLVEGQVRLNEGQARLTDRIDVLTEQMTRAATLINALADGQAKLAERVDGFTAAVLRGFTDGAGRDHVIEKRVDALEERVTNLERG